jgi:hypothetical protein
MIRIDEKEDGFHIHAKSWFQLMDDPSAAETFSPISGGPQKTLTVANDRAMRAVEGNVIRILQGVLLRKSGMG